MSQKNLTIIGLGGVGSWLLQALSPFLNYSTDEWNVKLVDGDEYEESNRTRQAFDKLGPKADVQAEWVDEKYPKVQVNPIFGYVSNAEDCVSPSHVIQENSFIFSCVDNHKTRLLIQKHCETLKDVVLISGGNELVDGNVQVFIREGGESKTPTIYDYHPEIANPADKSPDEMSCEELAVSQPQLVITNLATASGMLNVFYSITQGSFNPLFAEYYTDVLMNKTQPRERERRT